MSDKLKRGYKMITIKNLKLSELYVLLDLLKKEHGNYVSSINEYLGQEYCDYDDGLTVIIYPDTIENDL